MKIAVKEFFTGYFTMAGFPSKSEGVKYMESVGITKIDFKTPEQAIAEMKKYAKIYKVKKGDKKAKKAEKVEEHTVYVSMRIPFKLTIWNGKGKLPTIKYDDRTFYYTMTYTSESEKKRKLRYMEKEGREMIEYTVHTSANIDIEFYDAEVSYVTKDELDKRAGNPKLIRMFKVAPSDYRFIIDGIELNTPKADGLCVPEYLLETYKKKIPSLTLEKIINILRLGDIQMECDAEDGYCVQHVQAFCDHYKISHYALDISSALFHKKVYHNSHYTPLIYHMADSHMYPVTDAKTRTHITKSAAMSENITQNKTTTNVFRNKFSKDAEDKSKRFELDYYQDVPIERLKELKDCNVFYHTGNLHDLYVEYYRKYGVMLKVINYSHTLTALEIKDQNVRLFINANHASGIDWTPIMTLCKLLNIPFQNQTLTSLTKQIFEMFHTKGNKTERLPIKESERNTVAKRQSGKCNNCGEKCEKMEIDHIIPVSRGGESALSNYQGLCTPCHDEKSRKECAERNFKIDNIVSCYNNTTKDIFVHTKKNAFVHNYENFDDVVFKIQNGINEPFGLDHNKCRKNILRYLIDEFCVFSVLDDPKPFTDDMEIVTGFYNIESTNLLPLKGNGWYSHPMVRYCLQNNIIEKKQIKYALIPSLTLKGDYFVKFIDYVWAIAPESLAKLMINSFIGSFAHKTNTLRRSYLTRSLNECSYHVFNHNNVSIGVFDGLKKNDRFYEVLYRNDSQLNEGCSPMYCQILDIEAIELHKTVTLLEKNGGDVVQINTDNAVALFPVDFNFSSLTEAINNTWWDNSPEYKFKEQSKISERIANRREEVCQKEFEYNEQEYTIIGDPQDDDKEKFKDFAKKLIDSGKSFQLDAPAGAGKTTLLNQIVKQLTEDGKKVVCLAPTHKASRLLTNGMTIDSFFSKFNGTDFRVINGIDYIIIDEKSMVRELFFRLLYLIQNNTNCKFILSGDWRQLPPVMDRCDFDYENSNVVYELSDGVMVKLIKCRRADDVLFNICQTLDVPKEMFGGEVKQKCLTYHNSRRKVVNTAWMKKLKPKGAEILKRNKHDKQSQDIYLYKGLPLIASKTRSFGEGESAKRICNSEEFVVMKFDSKAVYIDRDDHTESFTIPIEKVTDIFHPAYCISIHRSQGSTYNTPYSILEWDQLSDTLKYVALSRATHENLINILN